MSAKNNTEHIIIAHAKQNENGEERRKFIQKKMTMMMIMTMMRIEEIILKTNLAVM